MRFYYPDNLGYTDTRESASAQHCLDNRGRTVPPSQRTVNGEDWHSSITLAFTMGARVYSMIAVVFVLLEAKYWAIILSGNITLVNLYN